MSKPSHTAYIVTKTGEGDRKKAYWREVGAVWPHKNSNGFDLVIHDQLAVSGPILITERKENAAEHIAPHVAESDRREPVISSVTGCQFGCLPNMIQPPLLGVVNAASAVSARTPTCRALAVPRSCSMLSV